MWVAAALLPHGWARRNNIQWRSDVVGSSQVPGGLLLVLALLTAPLVGAAVSHAAGPYAGLLAGTVLIVAACVQYEVRDMGMSPRHTDAARAARGLLPLGEDDDPWLSDDDEATELVLA